MPTSGLMLALATVLFAIGSSIYAWCVFDFGSFGRGTPAPIDPPKKLVTGGLYRYSRNPMYVGVLTVVFGWAILYRSRGVAVYALVIALCFIHSSYFSKSRFCGSGLVRNTSATAGKFLDG